MLHGGDLNLYLYLSSFNKKYVILTNLLILIRTVHQVFFRVCELWCLTPDVNNISVISWRSVLFVEETGGQKTTGLAQVTDKLYHIMLYRVHPA